MAAALASVALAGGASALEVGNAIENLIGTLRHVARNVKRWRDGTMIRRWVGLGVLRAAARFRRIKGHGDLAVLATALRPAAAGEQAA